MGGRVTIHRDRVHGDHVRGDHADGDHADDDHADDDHGDHVRDYVHPRDFGKSLRDLPMVRKVLDRMPWPVARAPSSSCACSLEHWLR